jgi:hypothetical protein
MNALRPKCAQILHAFSERLNACVSRIDVLLMQTNKLNNNNNDKIKNEQDKEEEETSAELKELAQHLRILRAAKEHISLYEHILTLADTYKKDIESQQI